MPNLAARSADMRRLLPTADGKTLDDLTTAWIWSAGITVSVDDVPAETVRAFLVTQGIDPATSTLSES